MARLKQTGQDYQCEPTSFFLSLLLLQIGSVTVGSALPNSDPAPTPSVVIAPDGTVHVTRVVPLPSTISAAARENLVKMKPADQSHQTLQEHRTEADKWQAERAQESLELYPAALL
jgi:epsilon-lactone hydrolase